MTKYVIKTGMKNEYDDVIKTHVTPDILLLTGIQTVKDLERHCGDDCEAIMSFGMCGGIGPRPSVGENWVASKLIGPYQELYYPDQTWLLRLQRATNANICQWFSNGKFNTANDPHQRRTLYNETGAWCIDDESLFVAQFAQKKGIRWATCRNVSDGYLDNVNIASHLLNVGGGVNIWNVIKAFTIDPVDMIKIWRDYSTSNKELGVAAVCLASIHWGFIK